MTTLLAFAFVIGVLVFVHELGHFLAARRIGVRVLKFSLGFGPRVVGLRGAGLALRQLPPSGDPFAEGRSVRSSRDPVERGCGSAGRELIVVVRRRRQFGSWVVVLSVAMAAGGATCLL